MTRDEQVANTNRNAFYKWLKNQDVDTVELFSLLGTARKIDQLIITEHVSPLGLFASKDMTIYRNLMRLNIKLKCGMADEEIYEAVNSGLGWYRRCGMNTVNYLLSPKVLAMPNKKENRPGLVDPLAYYLGNTE